MISRLLLHFVVAWLILWAGFSTLATILHYPRPDDTGARAAFWSAVIWVGVVWWFEKNREESEKGS